MISDLILVMDVNDEAIITKISKRIDIQIKENDKNGYLLISVFRFQYRDSNHNSIDEKGNLQKYRRLNGSSLGTLLINEAEK